MGTEDQKKEEDVEEEGPTKAEKKAAIMKRRMELEQAKKRDQKLQWKRRYNYDINEIITPYNLCVIVYTLTSKVLTNEDAMLLMTPLVETEKSDDLIIYHNSMDSQRTKRLRVIVEKQGVPPRIYP